MIHKINPYQHLKYKGTKYPIAGVELLPQSKRGIYDTHDSAEIFAIVESEVSIDSGDLVYLNHFKFDIDSYCKVIKKIQIIDTDLQALFLIKISKVVLK